MGARTRRVVGLIAVPIAVAVALTTGVTVPSAAAPTVDKADPPAATIPQRYLAQQVDWTRCDFDEEIKAAVPSAPDSQCASVIVPMDWLHPDAHPDIQLAISWTKASGTSKGMLNLNPGGPGAAALDQTAQLAAVKPKLFEAYDLLGFDPRGYGDSQNTSCYSTEEEEDARPTVPDKRIRNVETHAVEVADAKFFGTACSVDELSQFVSTQQTVYDMEFLRRYLGKDAAIYNKFNFVGVSYGTWLGAWYADTYPTHTGRFILDSNMNWTSSMYANQTTDSFSFQRRRDLMFFPWVARHDSTYHFGKTAAQVKANYEKLRAQVAKAALRNEGIEDPGEFDDTVAVELFADNYFPEAMSYIRDISAAVASDDVARRDAKTRKPASALRVQAMMRGDSAAPERRSSNDELVDIGTTESPVRCNDSSYSRELTTQLKRADADAKKYPFIGYTDTVSMCSYWKYAATPRTIDLDGVPTILMVQSEGDPATAYEGALAAHQATAAHTRLVSVDDEGEHGVYSYGVSPCVDKIGDAFLLDGDLPAGDTTCGTLPMPGDSKVYPLDGPLDGSSYPLDTKSKAQTSRQAKASKERLQRKVDVAAQSVG